MKRRPFLPIVGWSTSQAAGDDPDRIPPAVRRNTLLLALAQASVGVGNQLVPALGALLVVKLSGSPALAGLATALLGGSRFLVAYPVGQLSDRSGRRAGLLLGCLLCVAGAVLLGASVAVTSFPLFVLGQLLFGLGVGASQQLRLAAADMYPPERRGEGLGLVLTGSLVGALGGPALLAVAEAAALPLGLDPLALVWFLVPVVVGPGLALVGALRPDPKDIAASLTSYYPDWHAARQPSGVPRLASRSVARVALVNSFAIHGNMSLIMALAALALGRSGAGVTAVSVAVALHVVGMYGLSLPLGRLADRLGRLPLLASGGLLASVGSCLVALATDYASITAGACLVGLGWSCMNVTVSALLADATAPDERGRAIGLNDSLSALSSLALPLLGGPLVAAAGFASLAPFSLVLLAPAVASSVWLERRRSASSSASPGSPLTHTPLSGGSA